MGKKKKDAQTFETAAVTKTLDFDGVAETYEEENGEKERTKQYERRGKFKECIGQECGSNCTGTEVVSLSHNFDLSL